MKEKKLDAKLEEMKNLQASYMKENPKKITANEKYPKLEREKLLEENLVNAEMVGVTGKRAHVNSFVYQGKAVAFIY